MGARARVQSQPRRNRFLRGSAGTGLDKNDIAEIQNAIDATLQGTRYEDAFSFTTTREIESDTSIYHLRVSVPFGGTRHDYADMEHRLQSSLLCHVYPVHAITRKSLGDMTRKLSVT